MTRMASWRDHVPTRRTSDRDIWQLATDNLGGMSRRDQILATAAELFAQRGYHGVSVADLGAACGISGPALYKHFPSKQAMLAEMLVSISEELLREGRRRVAETPEPRGRARRARRLARRLRAAAPAADRRPGPRLGVAARRGPRAGARASSASTSTSGPPSSSCSTPGSTSRPRGRWHTRRSG